MITIEPDGVALLAQRIVARLERDELLPDATKRAMRALMVISDSHDEDCVCLACTAASVTAKAYVEERHKPDRQENT